MRVNALLRELVTNFINRHDAYPVFAAEIEWYLRPINTSTPWVDVKYSDIEAYFSSLFDACDSIGIKLYSMDREDGAGQVETSIFPTKDADSLVKQLQNIKKAAELAAETHGLIADFLAKPYDNQHGSGLHIHIHLDDAEGHNLMWKRGDEMSDILKYSLAGLLLKMDEYMEIFAPNENSWKRFESGYNAPVNASWGGNNRTTALRLPDGASAKQVGVEDIAAQPLSHGRRIEHRLAGSDADPEKVIDAILRAIDYGLKNNPSLPSPIYGNASDTQYGLDNFSNRNK